MNTATVSTIVAKHDVNVPSSIDKRFLPDAHRQVAIESYSESLSIPVLPFVAHRRSTTSICNYAASELRFRESVTMEPALTAAGPGASFSDTLIVYPDNRTTRTRFRTTAIYLPQLRPKRFAETSFVRPKQLAETRYVECVEYDGSTSGSGSGRRWHTTSVTVRPTGSAAGSSFRSAGRIVWRHGDDPGSSVFLADDDCGSFPGHGDLELNPCDDRDVGSDEYRSQMVVRRKFKTV